MNYSDAVNLILSLPDMERKSSGPLARTMSLDTMRRVLKELGSPQNNRNTIHLTGSKGKGSTSAFIAGMLHASGRSTALYNSPHLHDYTERITINFQPIKREEFAEGIAAISPKLLELHETDGPVSTFGATTALFFWAAQKHNIQWQIVEVGLGGTHDATNVFQQKDVAVITAVSLEHTGILGTSNREIARNKAGIITEGCTVVLARQHDDEVVSEVTARCNEMRARLIYVPEKYSSESVKAYSDGQMCMVTSPHDTYKLRLRMLGEHQLDNVTTAIATMEALRELGHFVDAQSVQRAASNIQVAGRLEQLENVPALIVDGAHNGESAGALGASLRRHFRYQKCIMIVGTNSDKNTQEILSELAPHTDLLIATRSRSEKAMEPEKIATTSRSLGIETKLCTNLEDALLCARREASPADLICVTGSLYLVGEARELTGRANSGALWYETHQLAAEPGA